MFRLLNRKKKKGQSTMEFTVLIIIVIGALLAVQNYVKRAVQGSIRSAADDISEEQFSPGNTNISRTRKAHSVSTETSKNGATNTTTTDSTTNTTMSMNIINQTWEYWGS